MTAYPYLDTLLNRQNRECPRCSLYVSVSEQWIGYAALFHARCAERMEREPHTQDHPGT